MTDNIFFIPIIIVKDRSIFPIGLKVKFENRKLFFIKMDSIRNIQWYNNMFDGIGQNYHPNEIMACLISSIAMKEDLHKFNKNYKSNYRYTLYNTLIEWGNIY